MSGLMNVTRRTNKAKNEATIDEYNNLFDESTEDMGHNKEKIEERQKKYTTLVNHYYDLATDFYEYGWGQSFHFAPRYSGESFAASLARHEHFLANSLTLRPGMHVLDLGCGVGGPMRAIARFSGAKVTGVNNNDYQIERANTLNAKYHLEHLCKAVKGNFMKLSDKFEANTIDRVYAIEATCHAPDRVACFEQVYQVLKPGGYFAAYEWVMTDKYDPSLEEHRRIKHEIEAGDGLPDMCGPKGVDDALKAAGFEMLEAYDMAATAPKDGNDITWYSTIQGGCSLTNLKHTKAGRFITQKTVEVLEALQLAPKGTGKTHKMLSTAADALARGGELEIFTPMYFFLVRKPLK